MRVAFQLRRQGTLADVIRLKTDIDSYNDNNRYGAYVEQPSFNFELDLAEAEQPTEYNENTLGIDLDRALEDLDNLDDDDLLDGEALDDEED